VNPARGRDKISDLAALSKRTARLQREGKRIVFTNGCFDLLHLGHVRSLEQARSLGDHLIVAINSDASVRRAKGPDRPILPARTRMELVAALACVDWVVGFRADTPIRLIERLRPDVLAKGGDWSRESIIGGREVERWGGRVVRLRVVRGVRTSSLIERIQKQHQLKD
jgi:rfaE bifunctional protein nucleotidyltransferase chain/domain